MYKRQSFDESIAMPVGVLNVPPLGLEKVDPLYSLTVLLPEFATHTLPRPSKMCIRDSPTIPVRLLRCWSSNTIFIGDAIARHVVSAWPPCSASSP